MEFVASEVMQNTSVKSEEPVCVRIFANPDEQDFIFLLQVRNCNFKLTVHLSSMHTSRGGITRIILVYTLQVAGGFSFPTGNTQLSSLQVTQRASVGTGAAQAAAKKGAMPSPARPPLTLVAVLNDHMILKENSAR